MNQLGFYCFYIIDTSKNGRHVLSTLHWWVVTSLLLLPSDETSDVMMKIKAEGPKMKEWWNKIGEFFWLNSDQYDRLTDFPQHYNWFFPLVIDLWSCPPEFTGWGKRCWLPWWKPQMDFHLSFDSWTFCPQSLLSEPVHQVLTDVFPDVYWWLRWARFKGWRVKKI